jgi:hypothetical protein
MYLEGIGWEDMNWIYPVQDRVIVAGFCEHGDEISVSI